MKLGVLQMTCGTDKACSDLSIASVKRAAQGQGIELEVSVCQEEIAGSRGSHLNGIGAVKEIILKLQNFTTDWALKIDSDTICNSLRSTDYLRGPWMMAGGDAWIDLGDNKYPYCPGHAYFIRPRVVRHLPTDDRLDELIERVNELCYGYPARNGTKGTAYPEDEVVTNLVRLCFGTESILRLPHQQCVSFHGLWDFERDGLQCSRDNAKDWSCRFDFMEFGRFMEFPKDMKREERVGEWTRPAMQNYFELCK